MPEDLQDPFEPVRDRRDDGRPEQSRPRDRTGRPLPYGTTGVPLTEEHEPADVEDALALGERLWDEQRFFEAHECLEHVWHAAPVSDTMLWQGVIQLAVAGVHLQRGNPVGARTLLERVQDRLAGYPAAHRGIDVAGMRRRCEQLLAEVDAGTLPAPDAVGPFPHAPGGAWFAFEADATGPSDEPTPLPDGPRWLADGQPRPASNR